MFRAVAVCVHCRSIIEEQARFCPHCGRPLSERRPRSKIELGVELDLGWGKAMVGERIGEGGMGVVHRGWLYYNPAGPRGGSAPHPVAIKALNPLLRGHQRARQLFLGEASALERLDHPNIVRFFGLLQSGGQLALVMELVEGKPLNEIIHEQRVRAAPGGIPCLPFMEAWRVFSQLLGALAAIHSLGIIHRDVKPSNVLVRYDGVVKLTDFGIARVPQEEVRNTGGMQPGTGAYMSPEQVLGHDLDPRADLYSAAIVLFEMLTGVTPFDAPDRNEIMVRTAQVEETAPALTALLPQAPPILDVLFARCLSKDPMHRFGSAIELGEAIARGLGLEQVPGWAEQKRLAENAHAISQLGLPAGGRLGGEAAQKLRTDVMRAYGG